MILSIPFNQQQLKLANWKTYSITLIFIAGNLILPQLVHTIPKGGFIFLPIYFFTLIASYKFGINAGILTGIGSPLVNHFLFGMPPSPVLLPIIIKSFLLALIASLVAKKFSRVSLLLLVVVVLSYQIVGSAVEWLLSKSFQNAMQDFTLGIPGMLLQVVGGFLILKALKKYEY